MVLPTFMLATGERLIFRENATECCICGSFPYHAPCLVDLETGQLLELDLYFPHSDRVGELADPQPEMGTFSFIQLGNVTGTKQTDIKTLSLDIPLSEKTADPKLCKRCRTQRTGKLWERYVLADLHDRERKTIIPMQDGLHLKLRCYAIAMQKDTDVWKVFIQGD